MPLFFKCKACSTNNNLPQFVTCTCILIQGIYNAGERIVINPSNSLIASNVFSHWLYRNNSLSVPETTTCKSLDLVCHRYMLHSTFVSLTGGMELKVSLTISSVLLLQKIEYIDRCWSEGDPCSLHTPVIKFALIRHVIVTYAANVSTTTDLICNRCPLPIFEL